MKISFTIITIAIFFGSISCTKPKVVACNQSEMSVLNSDASKANVRILNNTPFNLCQVYMQAGEQARYGALKIGEYSRYNAYDQVYKYANLKLYHATDSIIIQPIDFTGETPLVAGRYTYILTTSSNNLVITLKKD
jgi:hypothetical protein